MTAILEVRELVKHYGEVEAVKEVSFDVQEGEIFSLLGPNGAGKTTTISVDIQEPNLEAVFLHPTGRALRD